MVNKLNQNKYELFQANIAETKWSNLNFCTDFQFGKWLNLIDDQLLRNLIKSTISRIKCPIVEGYTEINDNSIFSLLPDETIEVLGLGFSCLKNGYCLSFASSSTWEKNKIKISHHHTLDGTYKIENLVASNLFSLECVNTLIEENLNHRQNEKDYLQDLTLRNNLDFLNLIFCQSALKNLKSTALTGHDISRVIDILNKLNSAILISDNMRDLATNSSLTISGESTSTMQMPKLARRRNFRHPILGIIPFEYHVKNLPNNKRMHILADFNIKKICVGYFGNHLPIVSEKT